MAINKINLDEYAQYFNDSKLWKKLKKVAQKAGRKAVYYVLVLYYVSRDPAVPTSLKLKVLGALGYFILPLDFIPDVILGLGFTDDLAALAWALFTMRKYITPEIERKARERLRKTRVSSQCGAHPRSLRVGICFLSSVPPWELRSR